MVAVRSSGSPHRADDEGVAAHFSGDAVTLEAHFVVLNEMLTSDEAVSVGHLVAVNGQLGIGGQQNQRGGRLVLDAALELIECALAGGFDVVVPAEVRVVHQGLAPGGLGLIGL